MSTFKPHLLANIQPGPIEVVAVDNSVTEFTAIVPGEYKTVQIDRQQVCFFTVDPTNTTSTVDDIQKQLEGDLWVAVIKDVHACAPMKIEVEYSESTYHGTQGSPQSWGVVGPAPFGTSKLLHTFSAVEQYNSHVTPLKNKFANEYAYAFDIPLNGPVISIAHHPIEYKETEAPYAGVVCTLVTKRWTATLRYGFYMYSGATSIRMNPVELR